MMPPQDDAGGARPAGRPEAARTGPKPLGALRSGSFMVISYALMGLMGVLGLPLLLSRRATHEWMRLYARCILRLARAFAGIEVEIRGPVPQGAVVIAAKHQSLLDVYILYCHLPRARFIMKRELLWVPVFGLYTWRIGTVSVVRGKKGESGRMIEHLKATTPPESGGQIVVYPQGTRVAPGTAAPYRRGAALTAEALGRTVIPASTNTGLFWDPRGRLAGPGTAVLAFHAPIMAENPSSMLHKIEQVLEKESDDLVAEARRQRSLQG
ncbi:MAG: lysophospholipid acyltransferase family protein [Pseudomonadota bacterium]